MSCTLLKYLSSCRYIDIYQCFSENNLSILLIYIKKNQCHIWGVELPPTTEIAIENADGPTMVDVIAASEEFLRSNWDQILHAAYVETALLEQDGCVGKFCLIFLRIFTSKLKLKIK